MMTPTKNLQSQDFVRALVACGERPTAHQASKVVLRAVSEKSYQLSVPRELVSTEFLMAVHQLRDDIMVVEV